MKASKALETFRKEPYKHNCAQAVAWAFDRHDILDDMSQCGGGKAKEGICGAAYAAACVVGEVHADELLKKFAAQCGSMTCSELKKVHKVPCDSCVSIAVRLAEPYIL